jgi:hypothetical protein
MPNRKNNDTEFVQQAGTVFVYENTKKARGSKAADFRGTAIVQIPDDYMFEEGENRDGDTVKVIRVHIDLWEGESRNGNMLSGRVTEQGQFEDELEEYKKNNSDTSFNHGENRKSRGRSRDDSEDEDEQPRARKSGNSSRGAASRAASRRRS